jgi:uncharacterized protein (TIGR04222 family)
MAKSSTPHQTIWSAEEIGFLAGGPGRAAEAVLARLMDGGLVRVSREGVVTAVHQNGYGATTALEAYVLAGLHGTSRPIHQVVQAAMHSNEMAALHHSLIARSVARRTSGGKHTGLRVLLILLAIASVPAAIIFDARLLVLTAVLLFLAVVVLRNKGRVTKHGKLVLLHAYRNPRSGADQVALFGLRRGRQQPRRSTSHGGGCGSSCSSYDWSDHSCGGSSSCSSSSGCSSSSCSSSSCSSSSCSSSSSSCSSSSSSCSSSSCSSSSSSSCSSSSS